MKGQTVNQIVSIGLALVALVVVAVIADDVITDSSQTYVTTQGNINVSAAAQTLTACGNGVTPDSQSCSNYTNAAAFTEGTDYEIEDITCELSAVSGTCLDVGNCKMNCTYEYAGATSYSSPLSRTIAGYLVPLALLGALVLAAGFVYIRFFG